MLVLGRRDYKRISHVVLYSFYKNIVLTLVLFFFTFYSAFSGQSLFDDYIYASYNFVLAWPVVSLGIFDRDVSDATLTAFPVLYSTGRERKEMNGSVLIKQLIQAFLDAIIIFFIPFGSFVAVADVDSSTGKGTGMWVFGTVVFSCMVASMFVKCALLTASWTAASALLYWGSVALYICFIVIYQVISHMFVLLF